MYILHMYIIYVTKTKKENINAKGMKILGIIIVILISKY
jgi:hypothetical protein